MNIVKMRSLIIYTMILIVCLANLAFAKAYDVSEISKVKLVTEYSEDTNVDEMDTVTFGSYPQSDTNGITKEPIEWIVLDREGNNTLLLSKYIIDFLDIESVPWENSNYRNWLNNSFCNNAFTKQEMEKIKLTPITSTELYRNTDSVNRFIAASDIYDKVFCLSVEEVNKYFGTNNKGRNRLNNKIVTKGTHYTNKIVKYGNESLNRINGEYSFFDGFNTCYFLLRDYSVNADEHIDYAVVSCRREEQGKEPYSYWEGYYPEERGAVFGLRPAIWVSILELNNETKDINTNNHNNTDNLISPSKNIATNELLSIVEKNSKWGVIDATGNTVVNFQYDEIKNFSEGLAACKKNGKWGFINSSGREVIKCEYDIIDISSYESFFELLNIKPYSFSEGVITLIKGNSAFLFDRSGNIIKSIDDFSINFNFSNGLALVHKNHKYGYIDKNFNDVITPQFEYASSFVNGLAAVKSNDKWGFIDTTGNNVIKCEYDFVIPFYSDKTSVCKNNKWGLIDRNGKVIIDCKYDLICKYVEGRARIKLNNKWGYIDENGNVVIDCKYNDASDFSDDVALVKEGTLNNYIYIDKNGKRAVDISLDDIGSGFKGGTLSGFINGIINIFNKNIVMLENAASFSEGFAFVSVTDKKGYINKDGILVIDLTNRVDAIHNFNNAVEDTIDSIDEIEDIKSKLEGEFPFSYSTKDFYEDSAKLMVNTMGKMNDTMGSSILNTIEVIKYGDAGGGYKFNNGYTAVKHNGKWGFINKLGELIINYQYDLVRNFEPITSNNLEYKLQESNEIEYNNVNDFNLNSKTSSIKTVSEYSEDTLVEEMDTVTFGTYTNFYGSAGYKKEPIEWIVLDKQDDKVLLLSKNIIDWRRYAEKLSNTWETCSLRKWLNEKFFTIAFNSKEQQQILTTNLSNADNPEYGTSGGNNTSDKIFLLSIDECKYYFGNGNNKGENKRLATSWTGYSTDEEAREKERLNHAQSGSYNGNGHPWYEKMNSFWLRSPGFSGAATVEVVYNGRVDVSGRQSGLLLTSGIRPAIWVSTSALSFNINEISNNGIISNSYSIYNDVLNKIESSIVVYEPGSANGKGKANFIGYQLYDVDNDGINELFIFRDYVYDNISGGKGIYIDKAYTIKNNQVELFLSTDYTKENSENGNWQNGAYYALKDGRILYDGYRTFSLIDKKNNTTEHYLYEIGGADGVWVNDDDVIVNDANDKLENAKSLKPYFDVPLQTQLISEEDNKVTYEYNGETYTITIPNVTAGPH